MVISFTYIITGRATTSIAFTQQAILSFFAPQGRHNSRISTKFGTAEGTIGFLAVPNFALIREYLGVSGPKKLEKLPKFSTFSPRRANPLPHVDEIHKVYADIRSTKAVKIWRNSVHKLGICGQKTAMGHFPKNFWSPLAPKLLVGLKKIKGGAKNGTDILYLRAKFGGDPPLHGGVRNKSWVFLFLLFVCLSCSGS